MISFFISFDKLENLKFQLFPLYLSIWNDDDGTFERQHEFDPILIFEGKQFRLNSYWSKEPANKILFSIQNFWNMCRSYDFNPYLIGMFFNFCLLVEVSLGNNWDYRMMFEMNSFFDHKLTIQTIEFQEPEILYHVLFQTNRRIAYPIRKLWEKKCKIYQ